MSVDGWSVGPFGLDNGKGATLSGLRTVLMVVHHLTSATRLADVAPLVERDRRIQTVYTVAPTSALTAGTAHHLAASGAVVVPFEQASQTQFDLAVAAGDGALERIHAPVLVLQHGAGPAKLARRWDGAGPPAAPPIAGLRREAIVAGGRVIPSVLAFAHRDHRDALERICPEALPVARIVGDPAYDRLLASLPFRDRHRAALGVADGRRLVVVSSTWGSRALLGRHRDLVRQLALDLPSEEYRIVMAVHPVVWSWHGFRQLTAWYDDCLRLGVGLLPFHEGWRAALAAADLVIGDHGSVTAYGAAAGVPVLLGAFPADEVVPGSLSDLLGRCAPHLDPHRPLLGQVQDAIANPCSRVPLCDRLTSEPGRAAVLLRREMYSLMGIEEPAEPPAAEPVPPPELITCHRERSGLS
ncbi:UDP-N-acetyl glucosamine 2-epimerase [Actinomadura soli]|uniref:UDP-N-acetyl glucosamine 2-epimerase n=1 Tax=Actinomadura soli TaxID=2508997 RepID=A0A5C4JBT8_9ACTN|nr:UDP-N-acetyl glucosamine 2-epimerase [Actinomadura soli]TMR00623.1 UDP-N-acetyl glucosamine 2-epimerase [Actinomadura soli]